MNSPKKFEKQLWSQKRVWNYLTEFSLENDEHEVLLTTDKELGRCLVLRKKNGKKKTLMEWYPIETFYDLIKSNYLVKQITGADFVQSYPLLRGETIDDSEDFINLVTDYAVYSR